MPSSFAFVSAPCHGGAPYSYLQSISTRSAFAKKQQVKNRQRYQATALCLPSMSISPTQVSSSIPIDQVECSFADHVKGEFVGYEASFSLKDGKLQSIPERYIPDEFKNWNVEILGFDRLTSTIYDHDQHVLLLKRSRMLPSVGCEADAVTPEVVNFEMKRVSSEIKMGSKVLVPFSDGSFVQLPSEYSLMDSIQVGMSYQPSTVQLRALLDVPMSPTPITNTTAVRVCLEKYDNEYISGSRLHGCSSQAAWFAKNAPLDWAQLDGGWKSEAMIRFQAQGLSYSQLETDQAVESLGKPEARFAFPEGVSVEHFGSSTTKSILCGVLHSNGMCRELMHIKYLASAKPGAAECLVIDSIERYRQRKI